MTGAVCSDSAENAGPDQFKEDEAVDEERGGDAGLAETTRGVRSK